MYIHDLFYFLFQEVWACWCELLAYLQQENSWLDELEKKLDELENIEGGVEELTEALEVCTHDL